MEKQDLLTILDCSSIIIEQSKSSIGSGGYGEVFMAKWQGIDVAVKKLHEKISKDLEVEFKREATIMANCAYPHVVRLFGVYTSDSGNLAMVMEYMTKGSLYQVLHDTKNESLPWNPIRWNIAIDVGKGLAYLHDVQNILHRDLKSLNVLLDDKYNAKIADFGMAKVKSTISTTRSTNRQQKFGTCRWQAPELFERGKSPNNFTDVYSYGMVLWEIASRELPYNDEPDEQKVIFFIRNGDKENIPADCPKSFGDLINSCWGEPKSRPSAKQLVDKLNQVKPKIVTQNQADPKPKKQTYAEQSWHYDFDSITDNNGELMDDYKILPASEKDIQKVIKLYQNCPVPGYEIGSVDLIYNPSMNRQFSIQLKFLQERFTNKALKPKWHEDEKDSPSNRMWRKKIYEQFEEMTQPYVDTEYPEVKLMPTWHGTKLEVLDELCKTGYIALGTTDPGYFGKGVYSAYEAEYSYRVYSKGALLVNWVACLNAYPIIEGDMLNKTLLKNNTGDLIATSNYKNCDAHFVPVNPTNPNNPKETSYYPTKPNQKATYHEIVIFQTAQCIPRYIVKLQATLKKPLSLSTASPNIQPWKPLPIPQTSSKPTQMVPGKIDYETGNNVYLKHEYREALPFLEKAAELGYPPAFLRLWRLYQGDVGGGIAKNPEKINKCRDKIGECIKWFETEAQKDCEVALFNLGRIYEEGLGPVKDEHKAVEYYQKSAEKGNSWAQNSLGVCYKTGRGTYIDYNKAIDYFRKSANQNNADAQYNMGVCYYHGHGVNKSLDKAVEYFRKSADQGYTNAQYDLAVCYYNASGVSRSYKKAVYYYELSAKQGNWRAQNNLGTCYELGRGVPGNKKNLHEALKWYQLSANQGYSEAINNMKKLLSLHPGIKELSLIVKLN